MAASRNPDERVSHESSSGELHLLEVMSDGDSFLPRIQSVFYAVFDNDQGPKIVYQVPEGLIAVPTDLSSSQHLQPSPSAAAETSSPRKRPSAINTVLFHFDEISKYGASSLVRPSHLLETLMVDFQ